MPIDPQAQAAEDAWDALGIPPLETLPPAEARAPVVGTADRRAGAG